MNSQLLPHEISQHFGDSNITDVLVNNDTEVWIERSGQLLRSGDLLPGQIDSALERILTPLGRRLDRLSPMVDARLPDGTRVCAVIKPIAVLGTCVAFRLFRKEAFGLDDFAPQLGNMQFVQKILLQSSANILITGATGSGKTSLLAALVSSATDTDRIIVLEDTHELVINHQNLVRLEARAATAEGRGLVSLNDLLRTALRLRPDRIVVGEVRGDEALTLVQAMSTGHTRCLATMHANSALDGLHRLDLLTMQAAHGWSIDNARRMVNSAVDVVVHMSRQEHGQRIIVEIAEVNESDQGPRLNYLIV